MIYPFQGPLVRPNERSADVEEQPHEQEDGRDGEEEEEKKSSYDEEDGFEADVHARALAKLGRSRSRTGRAVSGSGVSLLAVRAGNGQR